MVALRSSAWGRASNQLAVENVKISSSSAPSVFSKLHVTVNFRTVIVIFLMRVRDEPVGVARFLTFRSGVECDKLFLVLGQRCCLVGCWHAFQLVEPQRGAVFGTRQG